MDTIIELIINNGIGVACIAYFMLRDWKFMGSMSQTLKALEDATNLITEYFIKKGVDVHGAERNDNTKA